MEKPAKIEIGSAEWARFQDWFEKEAGIRKDWTLIAQADNFPDVEGLGFSQMRSTLSYLLQANKEVIDKKFSFDSWNIGFTAKSVWRERDTKGITCREDVADEEIRFFIFLQGKIGPYPAQWKFWPAFEDYFDLRNDQQGNLVDPFSGDVVVEIPFPANSGPVRVRTDYLQDYLAARNMVMIRQHDFHRYWLHPINELPDIEWDGQIYRTKWGCYRLDIINSSQKKRDRFSRLVAKDIITPYKQAGFVGGVSDANIEINDVPEFIVDKKIDGEEIKQKPDPKDILHPAYFNPKVLKKYYDDPSRYSVQFYAPGMGAISLLDRWVLPVGRNDEGLIIVWLGDLLKQGLSLSEINHWRTYNVSPRGGMADDFWNAQMMNNPSDSKSLENRLISSRHAIKKELEKRGINIFKEYAGPDKYSEKRLRIPLYNDHEEFSDAVTVVSRIFIEYLNLDKFKDDLPESRQRSENGKEKLGSILVFSNWLEDVIKIPSGTVTALRVALQNVQMVRSKTGVAHRFSDGSYQEAIGKLCLSRNVNSITLFKTVAEPLTLALEKLCENLGIK